MPNDKLSEDCDRLAKSLEATIETLKAQPVWLPNYDWWNLNEDSPSGVENSAYRHWVEGTEIVGELNTSQETMDDQREFITMFFFEKRFNTVMFAFLLCMLNSSDMEWCGNVAEDFWFATSLRKVFLLNVDKVLARTLVNGFLILSLRLWNFPAAQRKALGVAHRIYEQAAEMEGEPFY